MEKSKVFAGVLAAGLVVSLAGNVYLWNAASQWGAEYTAAIAYLEGQLAKSQENQDALQKQLEQAKADLAQAERDLQTLKIDPNDPFAGMTEEDFNVRN